MVRIKKMKSLALFLMLGIFMISFTSAWSTDTFNNSLTEENLTFTGDENFTRWLSVPENTFITNGFLNLSGVAPWQSDSSIISGLGNIGGSGFAAPTVFQKDSTWYLISGEHDGAFHGFNWTGSAWQSDSNIKSGLGDVGSHSAPTVFQKDSTWYLISGDYYASFNGFNWTGSAWQSDSSIISGLGGLSGFGASSLTVFQKDSTWYLISGEHNGAFHGFNWTGSAWQSDSSIISGLGDVGWGSRPTVFQKDSTWYLISGENQGSFNGFNWTGSAWQSDSSIISGLENTEVLSVPTVFQKDSTLHLISGLSGGTFNGFVLNLVDNSSISINDTQVWNYSGEFNTTDQTSNLYQTINNYISTATAVAGYYLVPFIFHSDTVGILEYFNLIFNNDGMQEINQTLNSQTYQTQEETFEVTIQYDSSEWSNTAATLHWGSSEYTGTKVGSGDIIQFTRTINIPADALGVKDVYWEFSLTNTTGTYNFDSTHNNQTVNETMFTLCNATYSTVFLNVSFKDEANSDIINASIPTSTFEYWLGDGTVRKTYTYIDNTDNFNYEFCATPNLTLNTDMYVQYKQNSDYPQRIYDQEDVSLSNTTTNLVLYLLEISDGLYVTFQVFGGQANALQDVDVTGTRVISGSTTTVVQGTTDAAGTVTFWMNPDFLHTLTFIKTGYETVIETLTPTQTLYTITMGGEAAGGVTNHAEGITITTLPQGSFLDTNTFHTFTYTIDSSILSLDEYGFELFYNNGTSIYSDTGSVSTGGTLDKGLNVYNESRILMTHYYIVNETRVDGSTYWLIYQANDFSLYHFFDRVSTYIDYNIFGIQGDDEGYFAKAMISILILILVTGTLSMRYGLASESAVTGLLFGVIFMLNIFNLIPTPDFLTFINLGDFLVFIIALVGIVTIIKEETR